MSEVLAAALGTTLGLQALRAFFPLLLYVLKDRLGQSSIALGVEALALFATAFLVPRLVRGGDGPFRALVILAVLRGGLQLWKGDPLVSLLLAAACVPAFLAFLAAPTPAKPQGFLLGVLLDVSIHALAGTRDLHWGGFPSDAAAAVLVGLALVAAFAERRASPGAAASGRAMPSPLGLLAWGPFLLLELELLGNVARHSARTGLPTAPSGALVAAGLALAFLLGPSISRARFARGGGLPLLGAAFLVPSVLRWDVAGPLATPLLVVAQLAAAALLVRALEGVTDPGAGERTGRRAALFGAGSVLLLLLLFLHYAGYDVPLPFPVAVIHQSAVAALVIAAWGGATPGDRPAGRPRPLHVATAAGLALLPLARGVPSAPAPARDPEGTVIVTFNFHAGFDERGGWAFERMLRELKAARPDVCGLQEVSRGWVINGGADLFELARERLGMRGIAAPTVRSDWGSAVFTREGILSSRTVPLPPSELTLSRAATLVERPADSGFPHRVIVTHLHHRDVDDAIREEQARALVEAFPVTPDAALLGDFNARPDSRTFAILRAAGWRDAAGPPDLARLAPTYPSARPDWRIDTILVGDLAGVAACEVAPPWGSDHRAVIVRARHATDAPGQTGEAGSSP